MVFHFSPSIRRRCGKVPVDRDDMKPAIRLARESDAPAISRIYRPIVESTAISFELEPPDDSEMLRRIKDTLERYPWLVCEIDDRVAGYAYASKHRVRAAYRWSVDVSIGVDADYRRWGVARGLYMSLFGILAAQGFFNAYAGIALPNEASVALHESLGFKAVGVYHNVGFKLGRWHDVGWWELHLRQHDTAPDEPLMLQLMQQRADWDALLANGQERVRTPSS